jgi:hypothetical protein
LIRASCTGPSVAGPLQGEVLARSSSRSRRASRFVLPRRRADALNPRDTDSVIQTSTRAVGVAPIGILLRQPAGRTWTRQHFATNPGAATWNILCRGCAPGHLRVRLVARASARPADVRYEAGSRYGHQLRAVSCQSPRHAAVLVWNERVSSTPVATFGDRVVSLGNALGLVALEWRSNELRP